MRRGASLAVPSTTYHQRYPYQRAAKYGYAANAASIGSLVWALTKTASDQKEALTGASDGAHLTGGKRLTFGVA